MNKLNFFFYSEWETGDRRGNKMAMWLFRGRVGLKMSLLIFIIFDLITFSLYHNQPQYQLITDEVLSLIKLQNKI